MQKSWLLLLLLLVAVDAMAFQNEPDGFRGLKWGQKISGLEGMIPEKNLVMMPSVDDEYRYRRKDEDLKIGSVELQWIVYRTWKGRLSHVSFATASGEDLSAFRSIMWKRFGRPMKSKQEVNLGHNIYDMYWKGEKTVIQCGKPINDMMVIDFYWAEYKKERDLAIEASSRGKDVGEVKKDKSAIEKGTGF